MRLRWLAFVCAALLGASAARAQLPARWPRSPLTEVARAQVNADVAFERFGLSGRGSTLCLVDTGVDEALDPARVYAIWDAAGAARGHPLESAIGGAVFTREAVREAPGDRHGHGTAMASIALGPRGMAPLATLLVAAAWDPALEGFPDDDVVRGIRFCRGMAALEDAIDERSMVILLSLGGHDGVHDGDGAFERGIVAAAGPVPVVVAAGNDGERAVHATGRVFRGEAARVRLQIPRSPLADASVGLTLHLERFDDDASARLIGPDGSRSRPLAAPSSFTLGGAGVRVEPRDDALSVTLGARDGSLPSGAWVIEVHGSARFEVWLAGARLGPTFFPASLGGAHALTTESITIPATAPGLIAVGASIARPRVGSLASIGAAGDIAPFSSRGPTTAGVPKPDLVAPGGWILARLSGDVREGDRENLIGGRSDHVIDGRVAVRGSSASAAVVAGALLLALELDPSRGPEARELLVASTRESGWAADRGFGALDVGRLLARWSGEAVEHRELTAARTRYAPRGGGLWLSARGTGTRLAVRLGRQTVETPIPGGSAQVFIDPGPVSAGEVLVFEGAIDDTPLGRVEVLVVPARRGAFAPAGGGCAAAHRRSPPWTASAIGLLAALVARRRRRRGLERDQRGPSLDELARAASRGAGLRD